MPIKSNVLGPGSLKFGEVASQREFAAQLTKCELTPDISEEDDLHVLSGETLSGEDTITWTIGGTVLQDYELDSLADYCLEHTGELLPFVFTPNDDAARLWTGVAKIRPIKIGGDVKKRNTSDFTFPLTGTPTPGEVE